MVAKSGWAILLISRSRISGGGGGGLQPPKPPVPTPLINTHACTAIARVSICAPFQHNYIQSELDAHF